MFRRNIFILTLLTAFSILPVSAGAQQPQGQYEEKEKDKKREEHPIERLKAHTKDLLKSLSRESLEFVYAVRMRDGTIRTARYIEDTVAGAVKACSEEQPEMLDDLRARFEKWRGQIDPLMEAASENLQTAVESQDVIPPEQIKKHLALVEETATYTQRQLPKEYVTTREACEYLLNNMDKSEKTLTAQLREALEDYPEPGSASRETEKTQETEKPQE